MTPAMKPSTPKTRGNGASARKRVTTASTMPAPAHAAPQVKPIPIAPRMRRSHFRMIASDPSAAHLRGICIQWRAKLFVIQSKTQMGGTQEMTLSSSNSTDHGFLETRVDFDRSRSTCQRGREGRGNRHEPNSGEYNAYHDHRQGNEGIRSGRSPEARSVRRDGQLQRRAREGWHPPRRRGARRELEGCARQVQR